MSEQQSGQVVEINTSKSWENSLAYSSLLGAIPSSFTSTIRGLIQDHVKNNQSLSASSLYQASRLLRGPSTCSMLFFAAKTFRERELSQIQGVTVKGLVKLYKPFDLATLIALMYLYRRFVKLGNSSEWKAITKLLQVESEIGAHLGDSVEAIGLGSGLLVGSLRYFALATLALHDAAGVGEYLRHLQREQRDIDLAYEATRWDCTSLQISSVLLQSLGFGITMAESFVAGLDPHVEIADIQHDEFYRIRIVRVWIDALLKTGDQPVIPLKGHFYPLEQARARMLELVGPVRSSGPRYGWLGRTKDDINPETTPQLFADAGAELEDTAAYSKEALSKEAAVPTKGKFSPELLEVFSEEELNSMSEEELQELLAHMENPEG